MSESSTPSPSSSLSTFPIPSPLSHPTPPNLQQNSIDPAATWLVQKYGGTSVGKFAAKIADDIVPAYLDQHKVAVVCSARSGSSKVLGTTNLLLRAASEALKPPPTPAITPGTVTPLNTFSGFSFTSSSRSPARSSSVSMRSRNGSESRPSSPSPFTTTLPTPCSPVLSPSPVPFVFSFNATVDLIKSEHVNAAKSLITDPILLDTLENEIESDCEGLRAFLFAAQIIDEISPRSRDNIIGVGERLACKLVAAVLRDRGIDSEVVSLENIIPPPEEFDLSPSADTETQQLSQDFYDKVSLLLGARIRQCGPRVPVVTGFFGPVPGSLLRQVGRGYTDLLAALLSVGLEASELQIWKEVDGIFTADPRKVPTARLIPIISPDEAAELTYYGSEVIHPFTMEQVIRKKIPIRIKNVENPTGGGTVIHPDPDFDLPTTQPSSQPLSPNGSHLSLQTISLNSFDEHEQHRRRLPTAVTIKDKIVVLNVNSNRKTISHGFLAKIFSTLDRFGVVVDLISTSEVHVSMAIEDSLGKKVLEKLVAELRKSGTVSVHNDMAILSLVGKQMRRMVGIAGRMFSTLADGSINIEMISQGASEINISCVILGRDATKALNLIHQSCLQIKPESVNRGRGERFM